MKLISLFSVALHADNVVSLRVYWGAAQAGGAAAGACGARAPRCAHLCLAVGARDTQCRCATGYTRHGDNCTRTYITMDQSFLFKSDVLKIYCSHSIIMIQLWMKS